MIIVWKPRQRALVMLGASLLEIVHSYFPAFGWKAPTAAAAATFVWRTTAPTETVPSRDRMQCSTSIWPPPRFGALYQSSRRFRRNFPLTSQIRALSNDDESWETDGVFDDDDEDTILSSILGAEGRVDDVNDEVPEETTDDTAVLLAEYQRWSGAVNKAIAALQKKKSSLLRELEKAEKVQGYTARANLLQTHLYMFAPRVTSATVQDWEQDGKEVVLTLDPSYDSAAAEVDALFQQVRKLKRGTQVVAKLLEQTSEALEALLEMKSDLESASNDPPVDITLLRFIQDRLIRSSRSTHFVAPPDGDDDEATSSNLRKATTKQRKPELGAPASNVRKLRSAAGCTVLVGRNRRGNEHLSLSVARGDDIWMHARGTPGAHVLVLQRRGGGPAATEECLQFAADLAAFYSDARTERKVEVTAAQPKHVQKPRGAPLGAVKLREELRVFYGRPDVVPEDLKEARAVSGLSDEYRIKDKSKLRKQNRQKVSKQKLVTKQKAKAKSQQKEQDGDKFY